MASRCNTRNYAKESDPDFNPQFRRRWTERTRNRVRRDERGESVTRTTHGAVRATGKIALLKPL
jgi:hypothetical protein